MVIFRLLRISLAVVASAAAQFSESVLPILEENACRTCHHSDGVASATRLHFPPKDSPPDRVRAFGLSLARLVDRDQPDRSLLLTKPTNRVTHVGGERVKQGSPHEQTLRSWVDHLARLPDKEFNAALAFDPDEPTRKHRQGAVLRRLTHSQYNNIVRDLLGELSQPASQFPPEDFVNGFKNQYEAQNLSPVQFEAYSAAAERLARNAFRFGDSRRLLSCQPSPACGAQFVRTFGRKAFRRPLDAGELKRYQSLFESQGEFLKGAQAVVEAMLQSPHFLFRLDETADPALKPYAAASRLAFSLWDTMPDEALLNVAESGQLATRDGIRQAARRLLADAKAKQALDEFVSQWMQFDRVITASRDRRTYPKFSRETAVAMTEETRRFVADLVWNRRNFMELFTAEHGYVNAELANVYGVAAPASEFDKVAFPAGSERAGLLGQALFLTLTSKPNDTSPTARGLFVREQFLCQHVADPPPGVSTDLPPLTEDKPQTNRQRLAMHASNETCAGCHNLIDPIGHGLEKFDGIGERREKLKLSFYPDRQQRQPPKVVELDLDTAGWVAGIANSRFQSPKELGTVLAQAPQCQECVVKQYFRYVAGRSETTVDRPLIRKVTGEFRASGFQFQDMVLSLMSAWEELP